MQRTKPCGCVIFGSDCRGNGPAHNPCEKYPRCEYGREVAAWKREQKKAKAR